VALPVAPTAPDNRVNKLEPERRKDVASIPAVSKNLAAKALTWSINFENQIHCLPIILHLCLHESLPPKRCALFIIWFTERRGRR